MPSNSQRGATGEHTTRGVPRGVTSLTPYIGVPDVAAAVDFYREVFGVRVVEVTEADGVQIHAQLDLGNGQMHLEAPNPEDGLAGPPSDGAVSFALGFYCDDVDAVLARAEAAGATRLRPPVEFVSGDRFVAVKDPQGIRWSIMSRIEDLTEAESAERVAAWADANRRTQ